MGRWFAVVGVICVAGMAVAAPLAGGGAATAARGGARAMVILQIDLPFAARTINQQPEKIDSYGARLLSANPRTSVYIDAGAYLWLSPQQQGALLIRNGIRHARGFSVNDTQYGSMSQE